MYFQVHSAPPPVWISRAINPYSEEIFQPAFRHGGGDFFWNNPMKIANSHVKKKNKQTNYLFRNPGYITILNSFDKEFISMSILTQHKL